MFLEATGQEYIKQGSLSPGKPGKVREFGLGAIKSGNCQGISNYGVLPRPQIGLYQALGSNRESAPDFSVGEE
ncbi:hypothetical protein NQ317_016741 [Molorchus minor]|uniref:Uncharacterized protein n=1 Tax=Molorchus minor TaxID=1323400 RepID=A0ABQ9IVF5_9CUCU|nr:hypothetical protein NQ317_016741 [Molorchus minor]